MELVLFRCSYYSTNLIERFCFSFERSKKVFLAMWHHFVAKAMKILGIFYKNEDDTLVTEQSICFFFVPIDTRKKKSYLFAPHLEVGTN